MTDIPSKPDRNPAENLQSRLLLRAQELGKLDYLIELMADRREILVPLVLCGMSSVGHPPAKKVELDAAQAELQELMAWLTFELLEPLQELLLLPSTLMEPTYQQCYELIEQGTPEEPVRAMLIGWLISLGRPHPQFSAKLVVRAMSTQIGPKRRPPKGKGKAKGPKKVWN
ncbi:hypothetical protein [Deinococcus hopiensis]|uniref:Uncharacterized protein n=1 Tax=Deinococcus hopiensis KR-140 TaxID=695939 RepID=A0A1W1V6S0_9DEIO|nr:hypothetical protein [Deinococcus hopiensis]SMB89107.1 hypothetical protein SAMN00790413_00272 [Deinococcus hopiensis KR-140]